MGRAVQVQREEGKCLSPSQQTLLGQVGWWCKPKGEGRKVEVPMCLCHLNKRAQGLCFVLLQSDCVGQLTAGREGERLEPGGLSAAWRPAGDLLGRRRCL